MCRGGPAAASTGRGAPPHRSPGRQQRPQIEGRAPHQDQGDRRDQIGARPDHRRRRLPDDQLGERRHPHRDVHEHPEDALQQPPPRGKDHGGQPGPGVTRQYELQPVRRVPCTGPGLGGDQRRQEADQAQDERHGQCPRQHRPGHRFGGGLDGSARTAAPYGCGRHRPVHGRHLLPVP